MRRAHNVLMLTALLITFSASQLHWNGPEIKNLHGTSGKHTYAVMLKQANFKLGSRKLTGKALDPPTKEGQYLYPMVDGKELTGDDGVFVPKGSTLKAEMEKTFTELVAFTASIDGKALKIPPSLYRDLLWPGMDPVARFSSDGQKLIVVMGGSDGAGAYSVTWTLRRNGKCSRQIKLED